MTVPELDLAAWRRAIAELYAEVRSVGTERPDAAHRIWRERRESLYREHPQSPVPAERRGDFVARHFAYDPALRFEVALEPDGGAAADGTVRDAAAGAASHLGTLSLALPASSGDAPPMRRLGSVRLPFESGRRTLGVFWLLEYSGGLFVPFGDATNGSETYGAGRYLLDTAKGADLGAGGSPGTLVLDFNFAFHPSCAFDPRWSCPLTPQENRLDLPIRAGERLV